MVSLSESAKDFVALVWPKIVKEGWLQGNLVPIEATTTVEWANKLDMLAGIDAWLVKDDIGIAGIASRVQWRPPWHSTKYPYNTFNIRWSLPSGKKTEYQKRREAILSNGELIYPYCTSHAYLESKLLGPLLSVGLVRTQDLVESISLGHGFNKENPQDGRVFKVIPWDLLYDLGYNIRTFKEAP